MAEGTLVGSLITLPLSLSLAQSSFTLVFLLCLSTAEMLTLLQLPIWYILNSYLSHSATFVGYPSISTQCTNVSNSQILTETKLKSLEPNDNSILSPHPKCPGYGLFSPPLMMAFVQLFVLMWNYSF